MICHFLHLSAISGLSIWFTFEENNVFAYKNFKGFILIVKDIMEGFGVLCKRKKS